MKAKAIVSANAAYFISFTWRAARQKCAAVIKIYEAQYVYYDAIFISV